MPHEHGGLSHGVELPQQVDSFPHLSEPDAVSFGMFGIETNRSSRRDPQAGHAGASFSKLVRINTSATCPHSAQRNS